MHGTPLHIDPALAAIIVGTCAILWPLTLLLAYWEGRTVTAMRRLVESFETPDTAASVGREIPLMSIVGSKEVAAKVYDAVMTDFYAAMLSEAEAALRQYGYWVVTGWKGQSVPALPYDVREAVARRVHSRRLVLVYPLAKDYDLENQLDSEMRDGYPQQMLDDLITGWAAAGVSVVPAIEAAHMLPADDEAVAA